MNQSKYLSSEQYRQMLVKDGQRRFQEWHGRFLQYQQKFLRSQKETQANYKKRSDGSTFDSEKYRQMLVKDGQQRFQEWHSQFLQYQDEFLRKNHDS
ncbi:hypothetical protein Pse7367_3530 [Thalassoporum mexicanum PCC 7367]|uniref:hypothetical protein n=1 Tax=Thalassoporum mexicanum TaxID=3457544 RepID=UPI00029FD354|nr:hypothetical protein [Pseudanabaena sp. PCC 7367]AFY71765.1 hypothetical protein Pse7367_3530 [Pseudanabaena sp. PCC 7367]